VIAVTKILQSNTYDQVGWGVNGIVMLKPIFSVVLSDGDNWSVEAEWPDGTIEPVEDFRGHSDAVDWLNTRSESWLRERVG